VGIVIGIPLTQGKIAIVDEEDAELARLKWYARLGGSTFYAARTTRATGGFWTTGTLHCAVWARAHPGEPVPRELDHRNGDGLDNRRSNLRPATRQENSRNRRLQTNNTSGFKGVHWEASSRKWRAVIRVDHRFYRLGRFRTAEDAARIYDGQARARFGEFATLNFPLPGERPARNVTGGPS
jgi:hypothetical protein